MILHPPESLEPISFEAMFGRLAPVEIEIGVGKGRYLKEVAEAFPERNFLGLEKSAKWLQLAAERIAKAGILNVRLLSSYAEPFLRGWVPSGAVAAYHINFPDPWPKRRHHKRRLLTPEFVGELRRTLIPGGEIRVATDHAEYYDVIEASFRSHMGTGLNYERVPPPPFQTNFRAKYEKEGRALFFARAVEGARPFQP